MKAARWTAAALAAASLLTACATERLHREGMAEIEAGRYEEGLAKLERAAADAPRDMSFRLDLKARREEAVQRLTTAADQFRARGALDDAERTYRRILAIEPGNVRATRALEVLQGDRRHREQLALARREVEQKRYEQADARLRAVLAEDPGSADAIALRTRVDNERGPRNVVPRLRTRDDRPVTLQFRDAPTKMVFEVLARQTGINFLFDKDVKSDGRTTIFVQDVPIEQAIDLILGQNQLGRQVLAENMVLLYPNSPQKQKDYQDQIVRTFYLTNTDPKKAAELLKTMLNAKTLFADERSNSLVIRDTPETVRMAERLIASLDVPEPEVMMEVEVLEISRTRLQQLGIRYPDQVTFKPTPLGGDSLVLADVKGQDETTIQVSSLNLAVDLKKEVGNSNLLASPRIRARNREKAKILIGQRVPVITNSVTPTTAGASVVTGNVQYVDVGLSLEVEPTIYLDSDVAIKVNLEVSNIIREILNAQSGTLAYQIGTRNAMTTLRLRDGETQILAGLINDQDRRSGTRVPGLGDLPLLGRLFGSQNTNTDKSEIVLSITPHIIRAQPRGASENTEFWFGTESNLRATPLVGATSTGQMPAAPAAAAPATAPDAAPEPRSEEADAAPRQARPTLALEGPGQVAVGQEFRVVLRFESQAALNDARATLRFDPAALQLVAAETGDAVPEDARSAAAPSVDQRTGRAQQQILGTAISGSGALLELTFKALSPRPSTLVSLQQFGAKGEDGRPVPVLAPRPLVIVVTP